MDEVEGEHVSLLHENRPCARTPLDTVVLWAALSMVLTKSRAGLPSNGCRRGAVWCRR